MAAYYGHYTNLEVDNLTLSGSTHITGMISGFVRSDISGTLYCSGGLVNSDMSAINKIGSGTQTITSSSLAFGTNTLNNETISGASLNIAIGPSAFSSLQLGTQNIAIGRLTGSNATGGCYSNLLIGAYAGQNLSGASGNCLFGDVAGRTIIGGNHNVAAGYGALYNLSGGSFNIAIGQSAGSAYNASESNNIIIGKGLSGVAGESGICRIGLSGTITDTYIAGAIHTTTEGDFSGGSIKLVSSTGNTVWTGTTSTGYWQTIGRLTTITGKITWGALPGAGGNVYFNMPFNLDGTTTGIYGSSITGFAGITFPANKNGICIITRPGSTTYTDLYYTDVSGAAVSQVGETNMLSGGSFCFNIICRK